mmetsp:Transcript_24152/g.37107  ORF Transcript_24152/g.37107 Transcript_24152/m.37107 type:complete len:101 (-) Transcript_24152:731-1033(-)
MFNYKSKLVPEVNTVLNTLTFNRARFFYLQELIDVMNDIDERSEQIERDFEELYDFHYLTSCPREMKSSQEVIREASGALLKYVLALNNSKSEDEMGLVN